MTPAEELLTQIGNEIKKLEAETRERIRQRAIRGDHRHVMSEEWARFYDQTRELRNQYDELVRTLATEKAREPVTVIKRKKP